MKAVTIGNRKLEIPIIQGGMGIGISRSRLAGAVAREGAMGVISAVQVGYDCEGFRKNPEQTNLKELSRQIRKAKEIAKGKGLVAVNIMTVVQSYEQYVKTACEAGADAIISGAGLPKDLPRMTEGTDIKIAPIVSSEKSANVILKYWRRRYNRAADFVVIEGPKAGGHLGFKSEDLQNIEMLDYDSEIARILPVVQSYGEENEPKIPVFVAGGILTGEDVAHVLELGADGVQVGSRFVTTEECDASDAFKEAYLAANEENIMIVESPVGLPGRAINNAFVKRMQQCTEKIKGCYRCMSACNPGKAKYCISQALINAVKGDLENGLIFCGARIGELRKIETVASVIRDLNIGTV